MAKLDILIKATNEASGPIGAVQNALSGLGSVASTTVAAAGMAAVGAVTAITGAIGVGVGKAAELEQGVADIASVMGITFDEAQPLGELIADLGMDPKLKVDAMGASDAIMQLAQSGIAMDDIMQGAARSTVLLSNATGGDMATSAAVASDAMALFGIRAEDMQDAVNGITGVTVASKFGIADYQYALAAAGGVASAVGVSFDDFNATISAISPYFASGSDAGTSFKTFLQRLVPQSNEATAAMQELGLITADGSNQFFDASGNMRSMEEIAGLLQAATEGLSEEQQNAAYTVMFGSDAMRAAFGISQRGAEGFREVAGALGEIDAEASAATRMNTFSAQLEILQGVIDGLLLQVGQAFLPLLRDLANWATEFVSDNGEQLVAWFESLAGWVREVTPLAMAWGQVMLGALGELAGWLTGQETSFVYLGNLWAGLSAAVGAAVGAIVQFVRDHAPGWAAALGEWAAIAWRWIVVDALPQAVGALGQWAQGLIGQAQNEGPGWAAALGEWAAAAWRWIVVDALPQAVGALGQWAQGLIGFLGEHLPDFLATIYTWMTALWTWIGEAVPNAIQSLTEFVRGLGQSGESEGGQSFGQMVGQWLHSLIDWIRNDLIPEVGPRFYEFLGAMATALGNIALELAILGATLGVTILTNLAEALLGMVGIDVSLDGLRDHIFNFLDGLRTPLQERGQQAMRAIGEGLEAGRSWAQDRIGEFTGIVQERLADGFQFSDLYEIGADVLRWIRDGILSAFNLAPDEIGRVADAAWTALTRVLNWDAFNNLGANIMQGLRDGIAGMFGEVIGKIQEISDLLPQWIKDRLGIQSPSTVFANVGENIMAGLAQGIDRGALQPVLALQAQTGRLTQAAAPAAAPNYYNNWTVNVAGTGRGSGDDVLSSVQMLRALVA